VSTSKFIIGNLFTYDDELVDDDEPVDDDELVEDDVGKLALNVIVVREVAEMLSVEATDVWVEVAVTLSLAEVELVMSSELVSNVDRVSLALNENIDVGAASVIDVVGTEEEGNSVSEGVVGVVEIGRKDGVCSVELDGRSNIWTSPECNGGRPVVVLCVAAGSGMPEDVCGGFTRVDCLALV
jgi:hypothetical protein